MKYEKLSSEIAKLVSAKGITKEAFDSLNEVVQRALVTGAESELNKLELEEKEIRQKLEEKEGREEREGFYLDIPEELQKVMDISLPEGKKLGTPKNVSTEEIKTTRKVKSLRDTIRSLVIDNYEERVRQTIGGTIVKFSYIKVNDDHITSDEFFEEMQRRLTNLESRGYVVNNIVLCYVTEENQTEYYSIPNKKISEKGIKGVIKSLKKGEQVYIGSEEVENVLH